MSGLKSRELNCRMAQMSGLNCRSSTVVGSTIVSPHIPYFHERVAIHFETFIVYTVLFALPCGHIFKNKISDPGISQSLTRHIDDQSILIF